MENTDTARILFHAYAWGDADHKLECGCMSEALYRELEFCVCADQPVAIPLLFQAYPEDCVALYRFAAGTHRDAWSLSTVALYWRTRHVGETPVWRATFLRTIDVMPTQCACKVRELGSRFERMVYNPRRLQLDPGDDVYLHVQTIAEHVPTQAE